MNKYKIGDKVLVKGKITRIESDNALLSPKYHVNIGSGIFSFDNVDIRERLIFSKAPDMSQDDNDLHVFIQELYNAHQKSMENRRDGVRGQLNQYDLDLEISGIFADYKRKYDRDLISK